MARKKNEVDFDRILDRVKPMGWYQILVIVTTGLAAIPVGMFNLANVFFAAIPDYWCVDGVNSTSSTPVNFTQLACTPYTPINTSHVNSSEKTCSKWDYDKSVYKSTAATEWNLYCSSEWLVTLSQTMYMLGFLFGAITFGAISDKFGRKLTMIIALSMMVISGVLAALMPYYWAFIVVRMFSGAAAAGSFSSGFVLLMEILGGKYRIPLGIFYQGWFAIGYMMMAIFGYFLRDFRHLELLISLLPVLLLPAFWFQDESPRWLLAEGKTKRAKVILKRVARLNKSEYPEDLLSEDSKQLIEKNSTAENTEEAHSGTFLDLFKTPNLRKNTLITCYFWFGTSLVYYGLSLGTRDLVGGPYINLFLSGLVEIPSFVVTILVCDRIGRIQPMAWSLLLGGACCIGMALIPAGYKIIVTILSLIGKFFVSASFALAYIYSAEVSPTVVRTVSIGTGSMMAMIAALTAPAIGLLAKLWKPLPFLVFGILTMLGGVATTFLPETLHQHLPETIEDGENFGKNRSSKSGFWGLCPIRCPPKPEAEEETGISESNNNASLRDINGGNYTNGVLLSNTDNRDKTNV